MTPLDYGGWRVFPAARKNKPLVKWKEAATSEEPPKPKKQRRQRVRRLSKLILDFSLAKGKCTVEFREGS
jgi:hypothetical protein